MKLQELATEITEANHRLTELTQKRDDAIRDALNKGTGPTELARIFGLTRGRIHQIRDGRR